LQEEKAMASLMLTRPSALLPTSAAAHSLKIFAG
jgi:hypothetical protein